MLLAIDQVGGIEGGDLKSVPVRDRIRRARLDAVSAKNAPVVIDVVDLGVTFGAAHPVLGCVLRCLDIDAIRGAGGCAKKAGHALFQTALVALQYVNAAKPLLELCAPEWPGPIRIVFHLRGLKHLTEGDAHPFGDSGYVL